jgi:hypothetical protein
VTGYTRFKIGDPCLYQGLRYTIVSVVWIDPYPGYFTWHIERLLDPSKVTTVEIDASLELDHIIEHGFITVRDGNFYQERTVSDSELSRLDDPPTWYEVDRLKAQIFILNEALKLKYRQTGRKKVQS